MKFTILLLHLILLIKNVISQSASCDYLRSGSSFYTCTLTLINPNGFDNFTYISGSHLDDKTNDDVIRVIRHSSSISTNFPSIICEYFKNAEVIEFDSVGLTKIGENSFNNCINLRQLDIRSNEISEISENAFIENVNLTVLFVYRNLLRNLSKNIVAKQRSLTTLSFSNNLIENLPDGIFDNLHELRILYLHNNQFTDLPQNIFSSLTKLETLYLDGNNLTTIHSDSFGVHNYFSEFFFESNNINAFDERLISNSNISSIDGAYNPCILTNSSITDNSPDRNQIRAALARCFENYEPREETISSTTDSNQNQCKIGDLDNRVCYLEDESEETRENIGNLKLENERLDDEIQSLNAENGEMRNKIENIKDQMEALKDLVQELASRP